MASIQSGILSRIQVGPVPAGACSRVIELHRLVFPPRQVNTTIYAAPGVERYLESLIAFPKLQNEHEIWGAWQGDELVGYAHFRALPDSWHLNNITVLPALHGQGIGSELWNCFATTGRRRDFQFISLDVESENTLAIEWYTRHSMYPTGELWRYEKELPTASDFLKEKSPLRLIGWDQAEAWQTAYGFSHFQIQHRNETWKVGRLGTRYFRVTQPIPLAIEAALTHIDPSRRLLIHSREPLMAPGIQELGKSLRMKATLSEGR